MGYMKLRTQVFRGWTLALAASLSVTGAAVLVVGPGITVAQAATCVKAGTSGFTAAMVATPGQTISNQSIDATGCDLGIYVGPAADGVTIDGVTVTGAGNHAIYAQDVTGLVVQNSNIHDNGVAPTRGVAENKAIELDGTTNSSVLNNTVTNNVADGGIGVNDDGPTSPGAPAAGPAQPKNSSNITISGNNAPNNYGGCTIVVAAYNPGSVIDHVMVTGNTVSGTPGKFGPAGPVIGQIVVANDGPSNTVSNVTILHNTVTGSALAGIVLHANAPGDTLTGTVIDSNTLTANHWLAPFGPPVPTAIALQGEAGPPNAVPVVSNTTIANNTMTQQFYGVWSKGRVTGTTLTNNSITTTPGGLAVFNKPDPFSGYSQAGADGGILTFGAAHYAGSLPGSHVAPTAPIIGLASTRDGGGYYLAGSDGNVYNFGDGMPLGSPHSSGIHLASPIVGIAATHPGSGHGPGPNGVGYVLAASDGGVFNYGDAKYFGSMGGKALAAPIVGIATTPDSAGYWLVARDGGVFAFGDAGFFGSMGGKHLNAPIVGIGADPTGGGYFLVASDGGVFTFGDARFAGSAGGIKLAAPIADIVVGPQGPPSGPPSPNGPPAPSPAAGYWLVARDGGVLSYGAAPFHGSGAGMTLGGAISGMSATP